MRVDDFSRIVAGLQREASKARLSARQFKHFFSAHPALAIAPAPVRAVIQALYPDVDVERVVDQYRARRDERLGYEDLALALLPA
jgi:hypothetical protein